MLRDGHIYLIGFMCSGKTQVGRVLAERMGSRWRDVDRVAEERVGALLPYIQREGEAAFRDLEADVLAGLVAGDRAVISCGGGTPLRAENMALMRATGTVVLLDVSLPVLLERITRAGLDRPLLFGLQGKELERRVEDLLAERMPIYRTADLVVNADADRNSVVEAVRSALADQLR